MMIPSLMTENHQACQVLCQKTDYSQHTLIPVTAKMICSAVSTFDRFQLKDGRLLHLVKLVGAVTFYHEYTDNITIDVEDGTGTMRAVLKRNQMECSMVLLLCRNYRGNGYIHVIRTVHDVFGIREIIALDVCPVLSGNESTYHLLEVAYSFNKVIHDTQDDELDDELEAVDLAKIVCGHKNTPDKMKHIANKTKLDVDDDMCGDDLNNVIVAHMDNIANITK
jgi:hypothetical protein